MLLYLTLIDRNHASWFNIAEHLLNSSVDSEQQVTQSLSFQLKKRKLLARLCEPVMIEVPISIIQLMYT